MSIGEKTASTMIEQELGAAFVAGGIGSTILGITVTLAEISKPIRDSLFWFGRGGLLGGETSLTLIGFMVSWGILTFMFKSYPVKLRTSFVIALLLVSIGLLLTFPPVFKLIAHLFET